MDIHSTQTETDKYLFMRAHSFTVVGKVQGVIIYMAKKKKKKQQPETRKVPTKQYVCSIRCVREFDQLYTHTTVIAQRCLLMGFKYD